LASKQYISIIRLFNHCEISSGDDFNLSRAKKQLQAEFGIAESGFIETDGYTYTRHDVFEEIENPGFPRRLIFHKQIWNSPQILRLLEKNIINFTTIEAEFKPFWSNKDFDEFFSPYFAGPFNYLSRTFLSEMRLKDMGDLLGYEDFLQPAEREEAFRPLRLFFDENVRLLRNVKGENYSIMRPKIAHWINTDWHVFFNRLPHEFYDTKNDIIPMIINIGVAVQKSHRRDCRKMSKQLISLQDTPESLRSIIVSNHAVYSRSSTIRFNWRGGFGILWIIFMIMRSSTQGCGDNSYHSRFSPDDIKYLPDSTVFKILKDTSHRNHPDTLHY
jgi:hypothetical protein